MWGEDDRNNAKNHMELCQEIIPTEVGKFNGVESRINWKTLEQSRSTTEDLTE